MSSSTFQIVFTTHYQKKEGGEFWKCWKAKFGSINNFVSRQVIGFADRNIIATKLAEHFAKSYSPACDLRNAQLKADYKAVRTKYVGLPYSDDYAFDVELVDKIITELEIRKNKASALDNKTTEHLQFISSPYCHPIVASVICKHF